MQVPIIDHRICRKDENSKKYQNISQDTREGFIQRVLEHKITIKEATEEFGLKFSTGKAILQTYKKEGRIGKKKQRFRKPTLSSKIGVPINNTNESSHMTMNEDIIQQEIYQVKTTPQIQIQPQIPVQLPTQIQKVQAQVPKYENTPKIVPSFQLPSTVPTMYNQQQKQTNSQWVMSPQGAMPSMQNGSFFNMQFTNPFANQKCQEITKKKKKEEEDQVNPEEMYKYRETLKDLTIEKLLESAVDCL